MVNPTTLSCNHKNVTLSSSQLGHQIGFKAMSAQTLASALVLTTNKARNSDNKVDLGELVSSVVESTFPSPLILPEDDLAHDPDYPPQSLQQWYEEPERNKVTKARKTIYLVEPVISGSEVSNVSSWTKPLNLGTGEEVSASPPQLSDVKAYLEAFYHGLHVKTFPYNLETVQYEDDGMSANMRKDTSNLPNYIGIQTKSEIIGVRVRNSKDNNFPAQLNLDDLLDVAISIVPKDAYALLMLVHYDIYEDEDDDFACGRAYGGSRVAVVSSARYNPLLDLTVGVNREHSWPASHCTEYINSLTSTQKERKGRKQNKSTQPVVLNEMPNALNEHDKGDFETPLHAAIASHLRITFALKEVKYLTGLWLNRVCRTASHELGHCFGIDHCVYFACIMQGSANLAEDARQPPYLCPVDLAKVLHSTTSNIINHYQALLAFCELRKECGAFEAFAVWLRERLQHLRK